MNINTKQLKIIKTAAIIILLMLVFPPYQITGYGPNSQTIMHTGYSFLFDLPDRAVINTTSLLVQWAGVCLSGAIGTLIFNSSKQ